MLGLLEGPEQPDSGREASWWRGRRQDWKQRAQRGGIRGIWVPGLVLLRRAAHAGSRTGKGRKRAGSGGRPYFSRKQEGLRFHETRPDRKPRKPTKRCSIARSQHGAHGFRASRYHGRVGRPVLSGFPLLAAQPRKGPFSFPNCSLSSGYSHLTRSPSLTSLPTLLGISRLPVEGPVGGRSERVQVSR